MRFRNRAVGLGRCGPKSEVKPRTPGTGRAPVQTLRFEDGEGRVGPLGAQERRRGECPRRALGREGDERDVEGWSHLQGKRPKDIEVVTQKTEVKIL